MTTQPTLEWKPGDVILDLYQVLEDVGEGSFGKVYKVRHQGWNEYQMSITLGSSKLLVILRKLLLHSVELSIMQP